ncbi:hypothetical protein FAZ19_15785 [Sphingobacterium alkalisoli]|uniref:Uncharacterized protein n=1 Tax=Sphingobacterium alkalisoli TaxID=1874115 RepID=A0A4U0GX38_9SPHI|nr:hypothetical protein [Sphingobacterium alkalisoli]TJY63730.1 hypothetical protein FAZ19_15785 [Sphingobacterium alkalisoli]
MMKPLKGDPSKKRYYKKLYKWHSGLIKAKQQVCFNMEAGLYELLSDRKKGVTYYDGYILALVKLSSFGMEKLSPPQKVYLQECIDNIMLFMENQYTYLYLLNGMTLFESPFGEMDAAEIEGYIFQPNQVVD